MVCAVYFFFFQAEDGILDYKVTGVQTCALPISRVRAFTGGSEDSFAAQLDSAGNLNWNTFLGAGGDDEGTGLAVDVMGNIYVTGFSTATWDSPVRAYSGDFDGFAARLDSSGNLTWDTVLRGCRAGIASPPAR